ncbi:TRPM8 channel-associated factor homolog [Scleropages formosus]|uniref:TRPM8 channel-associated factor homolog n=1 Tax=Scleropages formosus TaxID=113540 RepID=UPI0010FA669E|nr:TRPM8 channel-associated factor homolog [Scleropages formosus]
MQETDSDLSSHPLSLQALVKGIDEFPFVHSSTLGQLMLTGEMAVPVVVTPMGHILIAASTYGKGRVVVVAHEEYIQFSARMLEFQQFVLNAVEWLTPDPESWVGIKTLNFLGGLLKRAGYRVKIVPSYNGSVGVFCCDAYDDEQAEELVEFVRRGGGLLIAGQAWHWSSLHEEKDVLKWFPGNKIIGHTGIFFTEIYVLCLSIHLVGISTAGEEDMDRDEERRIYAQSVYRALVKGIDEFPFVHSSTLGQLMLTGEMAVPVVVTPMGHILIAASTYGKGRVVVVAHEEYIQFSARMLEFQQFVLNAVEWLTPDPESWVGIKTLNFLGGLLKRAGYRVKIVPSYNGSVGVFCCDAYDDEQAEELVEFVRRGGGLLIAGQAWHWSSLHEEKDVLKWFPGNKIIGHTGIFFTEMSGENGIFRVPDDVPQIP